MKKILLAMVMLAAVLLPAAAPGQDKPAAMPARPFHDGPVWVITFVHTKPGLGLKYMEFLASDWKREQEAFKKAGLILDYKVIGGESHSPEDWDLMLMIEFKDLATMESNEDKMEAVSMEALNMNDQKMLKGYEDRSAWRDILGDRLAREIILEPKAK